MFELIYISFMCIIMFCIGFVVGEEWEKRNYKNIAHMLTDKEIRHLNKVAFTNRSLRRPKIKR